MIGGQAVSAVWALAVLRMGGEKQWAPGVPGGTGAASSGRTLHLTRRGGVIMDSPREQQSEGNWKQLRGRLKEAWGSLTDDDLDRYKGRRDQLEGQIQARTGETRESIRETLDRLSREARYRW